VIKKGPIRTRFLGDMEAIVRKAGANSFILRASTEPGCMSVTLCTPDQKKLGDLIVKHQRFWAVNAVTKEGLGIQWVVGEGSSNRQEMEKEFKYKKQNTDIDSPQYFDFKGIVSAENVDTPELARNLDKVVRESLSKISDGFKDKKPMTLDKVNEAYDDIKEARWQEGSYEVTGDKQGGVVPFGIFENFQSASGYKGSYTTENFGEDASLSPDVKPKPG